MKKRRKYDREFKQMVIELSYNREDVSTLNKHMCKEFLNIDMNNPLTRELTSFSPAEPCKKYLLGS